MKKLLTIILAAILLLGCLSGFAAAAVKPVGDTTDDGNINAKDVTTLRRYLAGGYGIVMDERAGDTSGEGTVNAKDVTVLRRYLAGGYGIELGTYNDENYESTTISFTDGSKYRLLGRAEQADDGVVCNGCADGLEFTADCEGEIALTASASAIESYNVTYRVLVDGVPSDQLSISTAGEKTATLFTNVPAGEHTIRIVKDYELSQSRDLLKSVTLTCKPSTVQPTAQKDKLFVIVGDSDVSGFGVIPTDTPTSTKNSSSAVLSFGYLAAEQLGADYEILSRRSMGVLKKVGKPTAYNYQDMFEYQNRWRDASKQYDFARQADLVMVKVSGNDKSFTAEEETAALNTFIATVRSRYGANVPIIIFYTQSTTHKPVAEAVIAGDPKLYGVTVTYDKTGMGDHSTAESHVYYADEVVKVALPLLVGGPTPGENEMPVN